MTSIVVHLIASIIAIVSLKSHKIGRWYTILIILAGIITPIVPSALTSKFWYLSRRKKKEIFIYFYLWI